MIVDTVTTTQHRREVLETMHLADMDTTRASWLHRLFLVPSQDDQPVPLSWHVKVYLSAVTITWIPMLVLSALGPSSHFKLRFLQDWNVLFMFLVSFPLLLIFTVTDQRLLSSSLRRVIADGVIDLTDDSCRRAVGYWERTFRAINIGAQLAGLVVGAVIAIVNYITYTPAWVGFWIVSAGKLLPVGYLFLFCIFSFYVLVTIYVCRNIAIAVFLRYVVKHSEIRMVPFHPDKCGGLRPVGQLGLRNEYVLSIMGVNVLLLIGISLYYLNVPKSLYGLMITAGAAYFVLGPSVFVSPLLPFREGMLRTKRELMEDVAQRLRSELRRIQRALDGGAVTKEDDELIERLRKLGRLVDELPIWPFDSGTLRKFATAYVLPVIGAAGFSSIKTLIGVILERMK